MNALAMLHHSQGRYAGTERVCRRSLEIRKRVLEENHGTVTYSFSTLAGILRIRQKYDEAQQDYRKASRRMCAGAPCSRIGFYPSESRHWTRRRTGFWTSACSAEQLERAWVRKKLFTISRVPARRADCGETLLPSLPGLFALYRKYSDHNRFIQCIGKRKCRGVRLTVPRPSYRFRLRFTTCCASLGIAAGHHRSASRRSTPSPGWCRSGSR